MKKIVPVILGVLISPSLFALVANTNSQANPPAIQDSGANMDKGDAASNQGDQNNVPAADANSNQDNDTNNADVNQDNNATPPIDVNNDDK